MGFPITWRYTFNLGVNNTGLLPAFALYVRTDTNASVTPPVIHELVGVGLGKGWYYFDRTYTSSAEPDIAYVIDGQPLVTPMDLSTALPGMASLVDLGSTTSSVTPPYISFQANGDTLPPVVIKVASPARTKVSVQFSKQMLMDTSSAGALNLANYSIAGLAISAITQLDTETVLLTTAIQTPGATYNLTIINVEDLSGNVIA